MNFFRQFAWAAILSLAVTGCGGSKGEEGVVEVKVAFWGSADDIPIITNSIKEWQEKHPGIKVNLEHSPYTGYDSKILTRIAGGAAPDVIATEVDYFVTFASKGVMEDLTPFAEADPEFKYDDFFPSIINRFTVNGKLLAVPRDVAPFACVFYNKELFDAAGIPYPTDDWTWDDMLRIARALTKEDANGRIEQYGFYGWAWRNFIHGNGGGVVDNVEHPTKTRIDDPKSIEGLQFYADLVNVYKVMPAPVALANLGMGIDRMFASGKLAMFLSGIWESPGLRRFDFDWDVVMFPKNREGVRAFGSGGSGYGILKTSKHKKEAWEVIKALTSIPGQTELARRGLAQPSRIAVAEGPAWAGDTQPPANKEMLNRAVDHIVFSPFHSSWREIEEKYLEPKLDLVFNGKKTAAEVLTGLAPKINEILSSSDSAGH